MSTSNDTRCPRGNEDSADISHVETVQNLNYTDANNRASLGKIAAGKAVVIGISPVPGGFLVVKPGRGSGVTFGSPGQLMQPIDVMNEARRAAEYGWFLLIQVMPDGRRAKLTIGDADRAEWER